MALRIPDASAEMILASTEVVFYMRPAYDLATIAQYMRATEDVAREAVEAASLLGFLVKSEQDTCAPDEEVARVVTHASNLGRRAVFRFKLEEFQPFRRFKERIFCGDSPLEAGEKIKLLESIDTDFIKVKEVFQRWGLYANSFTQDPIGNLVCTSEEGLIPTYLGALQSSLKSIEQARHVIETRVGEENFNRLPVETIDSLSSALARCQARDDAKSELAFAVGTAVEKFLGDLAAKASPPIDLAGTNGLVQMAERLRGPNLITRKHLGLLHAVGALRNAADHGIDNEIGKAWVLTHNTIMDVTLLSIDTMRGILDWIARASASM